MKTKRILVTGLCLSRNRGGPAMALSFMEQIKRHLPAEFIFAVDPIYMDLEKEWAEHYGVKVIPRDNIIKWLGVNYFPIRMVKRIRRYLQGRALDSNSERDFWISVHREYQRAFDKADCVINLNGIAFVGDGTRSWLSSLSERTSSIYAKIHNKQFFRFVQSYGPFNDWRVRLLARVEFSNLSCVMARGALSADYCRKVAGKVPVYTFPDVAITLPCASRIWTSNYLRQFGLQPGGYIVLSPSAVIASIPSKKDSSIGDKHISVFSKIARHFLLLNKRIVFLPHMTSPKPQQCDRVVCRRVIESLLDTGIDTSHCYMVEDELDCLELKAIISGAQLAIVSRYHALVAALSTGIPVVTVGWNDKYQDLLDFYKSSQFAVDARAGEPSVVAKMVIQKINAWTDSQIALIRSRQRELENMVDEAGKICTDWIIQITK